ncbi:hypothetical protein E2C01_100257 [Portunus trituberculatus]|uniref:Uncharacterized protein n=1 Tax=Portunus trituberculatus TaxID=210409 RepID=A0A5B7K7J7_PORTR|nr:hypothetical protein [Portunus trituberculatus]
MSVTSVFRGTLNGYSCPGFSETQIPLSVFSLKLFTAQSTQERCRRECPWRVGVCRILARFDNRHGPLLVTARQHPNA